MNNCIWQEFLDDVWEQCVICEGIPELEKRAFSIRERIKTLRVLAVIALGSPGNKPIYKRAPTESESDEDRERARLLMEEKKNTLTEADVEATIVSEQVYDVGAKTTVVVLTLKNGFEVVGSSACVDPANYSQETGKIYARKRAIDKIWELEGYALQSRL